MHACQDTYLQGLVSKWLMPFVDYIVIYTLEPVLWVPWGSSSGSVLTGESVLILVICILLYVHNWDHVQS